VTQKNSGSKTTGTSAAAAKPHKSLPQTQAKATTAPPSQ
jgi:hypothetical protein